MRALHAVTGSGEFRRRRRAICWPAVVADALLLPGDVIVFALAEHTWLCSASEHCTLCTQPRDGARLQHTIAPRLKSKLVPRAEATVTLGQLAQKCVVEERTSFDSGLVTEDKPPVLPPPAECGQQLTFTVGSELQRRTPAV